MNLRTFLPLVFLAAPLAAQWDLRLEVPFPKGQSLPQTFITGTSEAVDGQLNTGKGYIASASKDIFRVGPILNLQAGVEYAQWGASGSLASSNGGTQDSHLTQKGIGVSVNAQFWVPLVGLGGEIGVIERFQKYTFEGGDASEDKHLARPWLRVGARFRIPSVLIHPYICAAYQEPITKDRPVRIGSISDLQSYYAAQGSGQEFDRMWTFGVGLTF